MSDALVFAAVCDSTPLLEPDAIVVLSGDGETRLDFAVGLLGQCRNAPKLVISGGVDGPPFSLTAQALARKAIEKGVDPERLVLEGDSQNTREQAENVVELAMDRGWQRMVVVASPFHHWRAFLTFVQSLKDYGSDKTIHVISAPASHTRWGRVPEGRTETRLDLLRGELDKIQEYRERGHLASFADALDYLAFWEGR